MSGTGVNQWRGPALPPRAFCTRRLQDGARALIVEGPTGLADGARTLSFHTQDVPGLLLPAQQEPADMGQTLLFHTPDAPGFLLSWKIIKDKLFKEFNYFPRQQEPGRIWLVK